MKRTRLPLLMRLNVRKHNEAYTIVEVMIFFVITGVLLISALAVFRGQQAKTQFTQGVRETDVQLRTIVNEIGSGYFPDQANFSCEANAAGDAVEISSTRSEQGTNNECIFLGKAIQFGPESGACSVPVDSISKVKDCKTFKVFTVAGLRQTSEGSEVTNLTEAAPAIVDSLTEEYTIPNGLYIKRLLLMSSRDTSPSLCQQAAPPGCDVGAISYYQSLSGYEGQNLVSGEQSLNVYPISNTLLGQSETEFRDKFEDQYVPTSGGQEFPRAYYKVEVNPDRGIVLCLSDGNRNAAIQIGTAGRITETDVLIDGVPAGCEWS